MKKKNGFTLIELLAVIVILAVIALIAVPRIIEILNKSRISAAEDSTYGIVEATESYVADFMLQNHGVIPENLEFTCSSTGCSLTTTLDDYNTENLTSLEFKGKKPTSGTITVSDSGNTVEAKDLVISGYKCNYKDEKASCGDSGEVVEATNGPTVITSDEFASNGITEGYEGVLAIVYLDPTDLTKECNEDKLVPITETGPNTGCMKWYAYKEDANTYTMIADHNITGNVAWNSSGTNYEGPKEALNALNEATTTWSDELISPIPYTASWTYNGQLHSYTIDYSKYGNKARLISAEEVADMTGANKTTDNGGIGWTLQSNWFYLDGAESDDIKWHTQVSNSSQKSKYAWLFDNTDNCTNYGCNVAQSGYYGYWTSSAFACDSINAWIVSSIGALSGLSVDGTSYYSGVRPVIIVSKSDLLQ